MISLISFENSRLKIQKETNLKRNKETTKKKGPYVS